MKFWYTAWIRDNRLPDDDQDYEWPLVFIIEGKTFTSAKEWGDLVAKRYALNLREEFVSSIIECADKQLSSAIIDAERVFIEGSEVSNDEITYASYSNPEVDDASKMDGDAPPIEPEPHTPNP